MYQSNIHWRFLCYLPLASKLEIAYKMGTENLDAIDYSSLVKQWHWSVDKAQNDAVRGCLGTIYYYIMQMFSKLGFTQKTYFWIRKKTMHILLQIQEKLMHHNHDCATAHLPSTIHLHKSNQAYMNHRIKRYLAIVHSYILAYISGLRTYLI